MNMSSAFWNTNKTSSMLGTGGSVVVLEFSNVSDANGLLSNKAGSSEYKV